LQVPASSSQYLYVDGNTNTGDIEMSDSKMVTVKVSGETKSRLDKLCEETGRKMRWVVEQAIIKYCDEHDPKRVEPTVK